MTERDKKMQTEARAMMAMAKYGMTCAEIAEAFGCSAHTVRNRLKSIGYVRGNEWSHARLLAKAASDARRVGAMHLEEPRNHRAVVMCRHCGTVREVDYTMGAGITRCPVCKGRRRDVTELARVLTSEAREREQEAKRKREVMARLVTLLTPRVCVRCGRVFHSSRAQELKYCSKECSDREWSGSPRRRARKYGAEYESGITLGKLVERDGLTCYICGKTCDWNDRRWGTCGPDYPTRDHVVPLAKGGKHEWSNVRVACAMCNSLKSDSETFTEGRRVASCKGEERLPRANPPRANSQN